MRKYPIDKNDKEESKRLLPAKWMLETLKCNPSYVWWGVHEDYMAKRGRDEGEDDLGRVSDSGWESRVLLGTWEDFEWNIDDYNECVNFYFEINRNSKQCPVCNGNCYHPDAQWVSESFYPHSSPFVQQTESQLAAEALLVSFGGEFSSNPHGRNSYPDEDTLDRYGDEFRRFCLEMKCGDGRWHDKITQDEVDALVKAGRLYNVKEKTSENVNFLQRKIGGGLVLHDAINRHILIKRRLERFGMPEYCVECEGHGEVFTEDRAHLSLVLWMIHPRKGASRGVMIDRINKEDLPSIQTWLMLARKRNGQRFSKLSRLNKDSGK